MESPVGSGAFGGTVVENSSKIPFTLLMSTGIKTLGANTTNESTWNALLIWARAAYPAVVCSDAISGPLMCAHTFGNSPSPVGNTKAAGD